MNNISGRASQLNSRLSPRGSFYRKSGLPPSTTGSNATTATNNSSNYHNYKHWAGESSIDNMFQIGWRVLAISLTMLCCK